MSPIWEQVTAPVAHHGEGPVWDAATGLLHWMDQLRGDVLTLAASGAITRRHVGTIAAALRPRRTGGAVIAIRDGFALLDEDDEISYLPPVLNDPDRRMNDGACDPQGRFYCGTTSQTGRRGGEAVYRLGPDGSVAKVLSGVSVSNGIGWSPDGEQVYYIDTPTQTLDILDFSQAHGQFHGRRVHCDLSTEQGVPDGLTVDSEGGIWVALWAGHAVLRIDSAGQIDQRFELPVTNPTACTFGGPGLDLLYVTSSARDVHAARDVRAGALFALRPGVTGLPTSTFSG